MTPEPSGAGLYDRFTLLAGPCVLEDHGLHREVAQ